MKKMGKRQRIETKFRQNKLRNPKKYEYKNFIHKIIIIIIALSIVPDSDWNSSELNFLKRDRDFDQSLKQDMYTIHGPCSTIHYHIHPKKKLFNFMAFKIFFFSSEMFDLLIDLN